MTPTTQTTTTPEEAQLADEAAGQALVPADYCPPAEDPLEPVLWTRAEKAEVLEFIRDLRPLLDTLGQFGTALSSPAGARVAKMFGFQPDDVIG